MTIQSNTFLQLFTRATHGKEDHRQRAAVLRQVDPLQVAAQRVRRVPRRDDALPRTDQEGHRPGLQGWGPGGSWDEVGNIGKTAGNNMVNGLVFFGKMFNRKTPWS